MRILDRDKSKNKIKLLIENPDDLWYIYNLLEENDYISALTTRTLEKNTDKIRPEKKEKIKIVLGIKVKKIKFHEFSNNLRIQGEIVDAPEKYHLTIGSYHTFNLEVCDSLTIIKNWKPIEIERLNDAINTSNQPQIIFLCMDYEEATIGTLRTYNIQHIATIKSHISGKQYKTKTDEKIKYYNLLLSKLEEIKPQNIVLAGPGFAKEEFYRFCKEKNSDILNNSILESASDTGLQCIKELLKKGVSKLILNSRISYECRLIEKLLEEISTDGAYTYGLKETEYALSIGAVDTLLVIDSMIRLEEIDKLIEQTKKINAKIVIISSYHDSGKQLAALSGIGSLLRYKIKK